MRLTDIGPFFIVLGTIVSALPTRIQMLGKAMFYFGFIFFGLDLVSGTLRPLAETQAFEELVRRADVPLMGVLVVWCSLPWFNPALSLRDFASSWCNRGFLPPTRQSRL